MAAEQALFIKMVIDAWEKYVKRTDHIFNSLSDEDILKEIAPGKNRAVYLLGHLTAVNDELCPLLGLGESAYPQLRPVFLTSPDKPGTASPSVHELRQFWSASNSRLMEGFNRMEPYEWFERHSAVSEEAFAKEPHRNKLNVLINRTNHVSYHEGQLILIHPASN
jgi:DinB family protein